MQHDDVLALESALGKRSEYPSTYNPGVLYPILRSEKRTELGIDEKSLPFFGFDCWNHYEVSWLNAKGKPVVALAEIIYDCSSPCLIESKSLKLYFNSFNNTHFQNISELESVIKQDLENQIKSSVLVKIYDLNHRQPANTVHTFEGHCIDDLDISCSVYTVDSSDLAVSDNLIEETIYSHLLKSNCPVTNQPDWGSVQIQYKGRQINREGLLRYIVSFRNHNEFHEQCIERIFMDIKSQCNPEKLSVCGRYTRRGGLDINPLRSSEKIEFTGQQGRLIRQ